MQSQVSKYSNLLKLKQGRQSSGREKTEYHQERNKMVSSDNFKYKFVLFNLKKEFKYISLKEILE